MVVVLVVVVFEEGAPRLYRSQPGATRLSQIDHDHDQDHDRDKVAVD
ncbi:MAG TPA: hypothetical protein VFZ61_12630 [Polyangiales bacterium]